MRKYLILAIAAITAFALTAVSSAQDPQGATMEVKVSPKKAGKKGKRARNSKLRLAVENLDTTRTMSELAITTPRTVRLNTKGLKKCDREEIKNTQSIAGCSKKSFVGKGEASAALGVNTANPTPLTFDVTAVVTGRRTLDFFLEAREIPTDVLAEGTIRGRTLTIEVPAAAQQPVPGTFAGLISIDAKLGARRGKRKLISTTGCRRKRHGFEAELTFIDNGVSPAGAIETEADSRCR